MTLFYGLCLAIFVLIVLLVLTVKIITYSRGENKKLEEKIKRQEKIVRYLQEHAKQLADIEKDINDLLRRIRNAQNDDDINSVISDVIKRNNDRVQNSTGSNANSAAETEQGKTRSTQKH